MALARAQLLSVSTAVPPHKLDQSVVADFVRATFIDRFPSFDRVANVFLSSGIESRYCVQPVEWFLKTNGWPERTEAYLAGALALFIDAARKALSAAGLTGADIDTVVTVSYLIRSSIAENNSNASRLYSCFGFFCA